MLRSIFFSVLLIMSCAGISSSLEQGIDLYNKQKFSEAEVVLKAEISENKESDQAHHYLGKVLLAQNRIEESIDSLKQAVKLNGNNSEYHLWLGQAYGVKATQSSMFKQAFLAGKIKGEFEKAVELDGNNTDARLSLLQYYLMAPGIAGGSEEKAIEQAKIIASIDDLKGLLAWFIIHAKNEQFDKVFEDIQNALKKDPENKEWLFRESQFYVSQKQYDNALSVMRKLNSLYPDDMNTDYQIGKVLMLIGEGLEEAESRFLHYIEYNPDHAWAHYRLGMVYEKMNNKDKARSMYKKSLVLDNGLKEAERALKQLK